jgi:hypothetical protein
MDQSTRFTLRLAARIMPALTRLPRRHIKLSDADARRDSRHRPSHINRLPFWLRLTPQSWTA